MTKLDWNKIKEGSLQQEGLKLLRENKELRKVQKANSQRATWKQKNYMRALGIEIPDKCTKHRAIELLNSKLKPRKAKGDSGKARIFFKEASLQNLSGEWLRNKRGW